MRVQSERNLRFTSEGHAKGIFWEFWMEGWWTIFRKKHILVLNERNRSLVLKCLMKQSLFSHCRDNRNLFIELALD